MFNTRKLASLESKFDLNLRLLVLRCSRSTLQFQPSCRGQNVSVGHRCLSATRWALGLARGSVKLLQPPHIGRQGFVDRGEVRPVLVMVLPALAHQLVHLVWGVWRGVQAVTWPQGEDRISNRGRMPVIQKSKCLLTFP